MISFIRNTSKRQAHSHINQYMSIHIVSCTHRNNIAAKIPNQSHPEEAKGATIRYSRGGGEDRVGYLTEPAHLFWKTHVLTIFFLGDIS